MEVEVGRTSWRWRLGERGGSGEDEVEVGRGEVERWR